MKIIINNFLDLLARIFISSIFLFSGINKILNYKPTIQWMEGFGVPGLLLTPAIIFEIILPILIIIGYQTKIASVLLVLFCLSTAYIFHNDYCNIILDTITSNIPYASVCRGNSYYYLGEHP